MSQTSSTPNQRLVTELKVSANLMLLDPGLFCVFSSPGGPAPDPSSGLPGVRITRAPSASPDAVSVSTFSSDGWLGGDSGAALVRISGAPSQVLVTIYQAQNATQEAPKLQVLKLSDGPVTRPVEAPAAAPAAVAAPVAAAAPASAAEPGQAAADAPPGKLEVAAHVQRRGDLLTRLGEWMGERGSQSWIEGFAISPSRFVEPADIEYQAVLGKGWLSPWAEGGAYCGSRGMALPILGLRVRLKGDAADRYDVRVSATFTDGSSIGPVDGNETAEAQSLAPLEAFMVEIVPQDGMVEQAAKPEAEPEDQAGPVTKRRAAAKPQPAPRVAQPAPVATAKATPKRAAAARPVAKAVPAKAMPEPPAPPAAPARPAWGSRAAPKSGAKGRR